MARLTHATVTLTETAHFQRLVQFLCDADDLARINADAELSDLANDCRDDLARLCGIDPTE